VSFFLFEGVGYAVPARINEEATMKVSGIRKDLNGMTKDEIKQYFDQCIAEGKIFIYSGGVTGGPIVRSQSDRDFVKGAETVLIGCTGGVEEALYFNGLMINYLKGGKKSAVTQDNRE
jgi:hypothetical protein